MSDCVCVQGGLFVIFFYSRNVTILYFDDINRVVYCNVFPARFDAFFYIDFQEGSIEVILIPSVP
ncbi:hypothetical protein E2C01_002196 [Portunus trituberculatus]|uniref:Uncharacterized protein n=1 Tax=Portunus trituberculatus TaxID=210409 RepID=A0A5B7CL99_PORTR|nr:hypothetical protein [Portunus trituberculatus]